MKTTRMENMKAQTTPGPWTVEKHEKSTVSMGGQCVIVAPAPDGASYGEQVANARLIASAPELLAVLKALSDFLTEDDCPQPLWDRMHNAIAAAEVA